MKDWRNFYVVCLCAVAGACAQLPPFGAELGRMSHGRHVRRVPYATVVRYDGWIAPACEPDDIRNGQKTFYLYAWIAAESPELGVRMVSPARLAAPPDKSAAIVEPQASAHRATSIYFDSAITFERCLNAMAAQDVAKPCTQWIKLGENDDSDELPSTPDGRRSNALLRVRSDPSNPLRSLPRGLYRIAFTASRAADVQGSYVVELGSVAPLAGASLARTPAVLAQRLAARLAQTSSPQPGAAPAEGMGHGPVDDAMPTWDH